MDEDSMTVRDSVDGGKAEAADIKKRLANKAHIFAPGATVCARCGYSIIDALSTPLRCSGSFADLPINFMLLDRIWRFDLKAY
jgi:hypothetical protein